MLKYSNLSESQLEIVASELAEQFQNRGGIIGLIGPLGSGKTTFTKAFSKKFRIKEAKSPTFVVMHQHQLKNRNLYHIDFYRLEHEKQLIPLGLTEVFSDNNIVLIEWVDKFPKIKKVCDILITLKVKKGDKRDLRIEEPNNK